jgi:tRNA pseudouridine13 synthase
MFISNLDEKIGIGFFISKNEGFNGKIRLENKDFIVEEIDKNKLKTEIKKVPLKELGERKKYIHFTLVKDGFDTSEALRVISVKTAIPSKFFSYAGLKDKKALTAQRISLYSSCFDKIQEFNHKRINLKDFIYSNQKINIGDLWGNHFNIKIRGIDNFNEAIKVTPLIFDEIKKFQGIPNFFGYQRFGIKRTINHIIGKLLVKRKFKEATIKFLTEIGDNESERNKNYRREILKQINDSNIKLKLPISLFYENLVLRYLKRKPDDYIGALTRLPRKILNLFIHSYQSYLFNLSLTKRYNSKIPLNLAVEGDIIFEGSNNYPKYFRAKKSELEQINKKIKTGTYKIVYPLLGFDSFIPSRSIGETINDILINENTNKNDFFFKDIPSLQSYGSYRPIISTIHNINYNFDEKEKSLKIIFSLEKGSYATIVLREFLKKGFNNC